MGDQNDDEENDVEFVASGEACGICQALDGTNCATLPHENCLCQIVPKGKECTHDFDFEITTYGPGNYDFKISGELTVTCPDGSEIGESLEIDAGTLPPILDSDGLNWAVEQAMEDAWGELCEQCPEPEPPNVA